MRILLICIVGWIQLNLYAGEAWKAQLIIPPQQYTESQEEIAVPVAQVKELSDMLNTVSNKSASKLNFRVGDLSVSLEIDSSYQKHDEYSIRIADQSIVIRAKNKAGVRYAERTVRQLLDYALAEQKAVPEININDWANFERRGYMLDISRDKVPKMESMYLLVDQLAEWRVNELQLYTEHTFAYQNHKVVWENSSPFTAAQIQELNAYCQQHYIDLVPNQNSFGHLENWLKHDEYLDLCECETDCKTVWGKRKRTSLAPTNPKSLALMEELYTELLPNFTSPYFNIGCDETVELCLGKSKSACDSLGKGNVYLNYLKQLNTIAQKNGKQTQFWGDIILNHPELISEIPKDMIPLVWGYGATYPFDENLPKFKNAGLDFYVCPGTSTWRSEIGRNKNAFINLKVAAIEGQKNQAKGYLITDWGDYGHFQPRSVGYASMLLGASYAWNYREESLGQLENNLNKYVFDDPTGNTAQAMLILGNAYLKAGIPAGNSNAFHLMIRRYQWTMKGQYQTKKLNKEGLILAEKEIQRGLAVLDQAQPQSEDAEIILKETRQAANLALFGVHLGLARLDASGQSTANIPKEQKEQLAKELEALIDNHKKFWVIRNRAGGLQDSSAKLEDLLLYLRK
ncbi:family 20 glycosylhydrolase [bacterium SCSIO 12643]|nr:family 20 glycosylhydrolase [bacterium SCSIO 12643]